MASGKIKSILKKHIGLSNREISKITKENIFTSISKNGKIKRAGGVHPFKEIKKSTHKK